MITQNISVGLEGFSMADVRHDYPGQRVTASIPRVNEEAYRAVLFGMPASWDLTVYSQRKVNHRPDEIAAVARNRASYRQLPRLPLLKTGNRFLALPVNRLLQREFYPRVATKNRHDLMIYPIHFPWGKSPVSPREMWIALDFHLFRSEPKKWAAHLARLRASKHLGVLCISEATAQDAHEFLNLPDEQIQVAHLGVEHEIFNEDNSKDQELLQNLTLPAGEFVLYVGGWYGRKNVRTLLSAMEILNRGKAEPISLLLAGFTGQPSSLREKQDFLDQIKIAQTPITIVGGVGDHQLAALYRRAKLLVHPSLFEGFGLTILEAMACATPVICGHHSSLIEVSGGAALELANLQSPEELSEAIQEVYFQDNRILEMKQRGREQAAKFRWSEFARKMFSFTQRALQF